ncbi:MAG: ABC transporter ATP-binding protein [Spirochaetes bacterium]|nr:ABC transporter ATP-binding protein [Spirochaetota bacterium]
MKKFLGTITNNSIGLMKKPVIMEIIQSILQGQPYFIILMVMLELVRPLTFPGAELNFTKLIMLNIWLLVSILLLFLAGRSMYKEEHSAAYTVGAEGRLALGEYLRKLSMGFFKGHDPGDLTALMLKDYANVEIMISHLIMAAIGAIVLPLVFLLFLVPFDWRMTLITLAPVPFSLAAAIIAKTIVFSLGKKQIGAQNAAASRMLEYLDGMKNIKAFNLHGSKFVRLKNAFSDLKKKSIKLEASAGPAVITGIWILNAGTAAIMVSGIFFILNGSLSIPYFLLFLIIGTRMYDPLAKVLSTFAELSYYSVSAKRIASIFHTKPLPEPEKSIRPVSYDIEFSNVRFHYHETDVLKNVSFSINQNTMTALVGVSGSGKSTITRLIARFWDVNEGEIKIGGIPVTDIRTEDLLADISMVFQDVYLFNDTIMGNIKVGKSDATEEEVIAAAEKAHCHEFIKKLPNGYCTMVGEGGSTLSGGEKQRISIARAILKNAPIVLLDEATASLDPENELYIQEAIEQLVKRRTLIVIAHRLSTITHADQILVLSDGKISEKGTHSELLDAANGIYSGMWHEQKKAHYWKLKSDQTASIINRNNKGKAL